jgi:imidazole glycerol-phosphate synthase subunit HisH
VDACIIRYNAGNCASVANALARFGAHAVISDDPAVIAAAPRVIFPGVGEAASAMAYLRARGLDRVIMNVTQPFLGICLGLQLLCEASDERDTACLGVFPNRVRRFVDPAPMPKLGRSRLKVPHMGWNTVAVDRSRKGADVAGPGGQHFYFVHGYAADVGPATVATTDYGGPFSAILARDNFLAVQFHPEKSGTAGAALLQRFMGR